MATTRTSSRAAKPKTTTRKTTNAQEVIDVNAKEEDKGGIDVGVVEKIIEAVMASLSPQIMSTLEDTKKLVTKSNEMVYSKLEELETRISKLEIEKDIVENVKLVEEEREKQPKKAQHDDDGEYNMCDQDFIKDGTTVSDVFDGGLSSVGSRLTGFLLHPSR